MVGGTRATGLPRMKAWTCTVLQTPAGRVKTVDQHTQIPAAFAGHIVKIDRDFLGKSIYMSHEIFAPGGRRLLSALGHRAQGFLKICQPVAEGEIIAAVSGFPGKQKPTSCPTCTSRWPGAVDFQPDQLTWENSGPWPRDNAH